MDKYWIEQLRNRFADRKVDPPDGLWESIQTAMRDRGVAGGRSEDVPHRRAMTAAMRWRRAVAVAACVALLAGSGWFIFSHDTDKEVLSGSSSSVTGHSVEGRIAVADNNESGEASAGEQLAVPGSAGIRLAAAVSLAEEHVAEVIDAVDSLEMSAKLTAETSGADIRTGSDDVESSIVVKRRPAKGHDVYNNDGGGNSIVPMHEGRHGGIALAVYGAGIKSFGNSQGALNPALVPYAVQNTPVINSDAALLTASAGSLKDIDNGAGEVSVKHRQPVKLGLSARFNVARRISLETGVNYSYHSADIASGDDKSGYKTEQKLHYVGIPLSVSYDIWYTDYLEVYGSAGGGVEFCVSGSTHTDYMSGNKVVSSTSSDVRDNRPQWSVNASAGIQYNFTSHLGIYAEPGVSYYFDNGSGITTIYKDKPLNFNLNVGLRLTIK